jgi:hypothetical protein
MILSFLPQLVFPVNAIKLFFHSLAVKQNKLDYLYLFKACLTFASRTIELGTLICSTWEGSDLSCKS